MFEQTYFNPLLDEYHETHDSLVETRRQRQESKQLHRVPGVEMEWDSAYWCRVRQKRNMKTPVLSHIVN
jgi:hypothetical protein